MMCTYKAYIAVFCFKAYKIHSVPLYNITVSLYHEYVIIYIIIYIHTYFCLETPKDVCEALSVFGHSELQPWQEKAIMNILSGIVIIYSRTSHNGPSQERIVSI